MFVVCSLFWVTGVGQNAPITSLSSEGSMEGANLQRTRALMAPGLKLPKGLIWASSRLFVIKDETYITGQNGILSYAMWIPNRHYFTDPIVADGFMYFSMFNNDACLFAVDARTGKDVWRFRSKNTAFSIPTIAGDLVYVGDKGGNLYALNSKTGKEQWKYKGKGKRFDMSAAAVSDGILYFNSSEFFDVTGQQPYFNSDESLYAIDAQTGQEKWVFKAKGILTTPAFKDGTAYTTSKSGFLYAIDMRSGREKWKLDVGKPLYAPSIADGLVYVVDSIGRIIAVEADTGTEKWRTGKEIKVGTLLAHSNGSVYFGGIENSLVAIDSLLGSKKWQYTTSKPCNSPVVADKIVYFPCGDQVLYAVDALDGKEKWKYKNPDGTTSAPVLSDNVLFFVDRKGYAYAIN